MSVAIVAFSKDRALQCDAMIRSFDRHALHQVDVGKAIIYKATSDQSARQYTELAAQHKGWMFAPEYDFHDNVVAHATGADFILFLVDDCIFVKDFDLSEDVRLLDMTKESVGVSYRLGKNVCHNFPENRPQAVPDLKLLLGSHYYYNWDVADGDWCWSLELSSSLYRTRDLEMPLKAGQYRNPNELESILASYRYNTGRYKLICYCTSRAFCIPVNMVQDVYPGNRVGREPHLSTQSLADAFDKGLRVDVARFDGMEPKSCHEEHDLVLA